MDYHFVFGPNMAVRAAVFDDGFRFDPTIGPQGSNYAMGSETEFVSRLANRGYAAWHAQNAQVDHFIRDFQMTSSWILRRAIRFGRGRYRMERTASGSTALPAWLGVPRYLFREVLRQIAVLSQALLTFRGEAIFRARWDLNVLRGQILEAHRLGENPERAS
jgi:hypothetical protein